MPDSIHALTVPKWGLSMEEGKVVEWLIPEGTEVQTGDETVAIETSKIAGVAEAPATGIVRRHVANIGEVLPVGALLAVITDPSVSDDTVEHFITEFQANFVPEETAAESQTPELDALTLGDITLRYRTVPSQGNADATPALLIHGFGGDSNTWLFNADTLAQDRTVYAPDLPGHGQTTKQLSDASIDSLAETMRDFMDALGVKKAHLAGHSLGAAIALALAESNPDRVASLTAIAPCGFGPGINMEFINGFVNAERKREMKTVLTTLFANPDLVTRSMVDDVLKVKRIDGTAESLRAIANAAFPNGEQAHQYQSRLTNLPMPICAIWGLRDRVVDAADAEGLPDSIQVHILDDTGHMPQMESANTVNDIVSSHFHAANS